MITSVFFTSCVIALVLILLIKMEGSSQPFREQYRRSVGIGEPTNYELVLTALFVIDAFVLVIAAIIGIWQ